MKGSILFVAWMYFLKIPSAVYSDGNLSPKLSEYLRQELRSVNTTLSQLSHPKDVKTDVVQIQNFKIITLEKYKKARAFMFLDTTYFLIEDTLHYIEYVKDTFKLHTVASLESLDAKKEILFIKAIEFKRLGLLLIATQSEMHIYGFNKTKHYFVHTISTPNAVDAHFFINYGKLYLIVAKNKGDNLALTIVYKWLGTHFDEINKIYTNGAVLINSFSSKTSEIIIILQYLPNREVLSNVYEFNYEKIKKIQHLRSTEPVHIDSYSIGNEKYVVIFDRSKNSSIYVWKEKESRLVKMSQFQTLSVIKKSVVLQSIQSTVLAFPLNDKIQLFRATNKGLKLLKEENYSSNFSLILDVHKVPSNESHTISIAGLDESNVLNILVMSFKMQFSQTDQHSEPQDVLRNCFNRLEQKVYHQRNILKEFHSNNLKNDDQKLILSQTKEEPDINTTMEDIAARIQKIQPLLDKYNTSKEGDITINGNAIIKGKVKSDTLSTKNLSLKEVNGHRWTPEQWLMYKEPQTITGTAKISHIVTQELVTAPGDTFFADFLLKNGNQELSGEVTVRNLTANRIFATKINDVALDDVYSIKNPQVITGLKTFRNLITSEANITVLNEKAPEHILSAFVDDPAVPKEEFESHVEVENLLVEWIDGVHWDTFKNSVFRIGKTPEINGSLSFPEIKTEKLILKTLNGTKVDDLFTTSTDQVIEADIEFNRIFAENITTNSTNNITLKNVVQFGDERPVEDSVKFDKLHVRKNLELVGKIDKSFFLRNGDRIIGTNESDLLQRYSGKITIKGNLYLNNLTLQPESKVFLSEDEISPNITDMYWTKSTSQKIPIRFQAQNGLTAPHLLTEMINNVMIGQYMLNNDETKLETDFHFANASIRGNVILNRASKNVPDLNTINKDAVKTNGSFIVKGKKKYTDTLRIENLATGVLEGIIVFDTLTKKSSAPVTGKKIFEKLVIGGDLISNVQSLESVNGVDIKQLIKKAVYIDRPQNLSKLAFKNLNVSHLYATKLNGHRLKEYILHLEKLNSTKQIETVRIEGDVKLKHVQNVSTINDVDFDDLLDNALKIGDYNSYMVDLRFLGHLKVGNLVTANINEVDLRNLTQRLLYRNRSQTITAPYSFTRIKAKNIIAKKINNVSIADFVDTSSNTPQTIYAPNGIDFSSVQLLKSLEVKNGTSPCDIREALRSIIDPPSQEWHKVEVKGNTTLMDESNIMYRVFEKTVMRNSKNTIYAPVNFSSHILAENVSTKKHINDVNIEDIINDAVVVDSEDEQIITGRKTFSTLKVGNAAVIKNTDSPVVNSFDIPEVNKSLVRKNQTAQVVIRGKKTFFGGLQAERLFAKNISNTKMDNIVSSQNPKKIPSAIFDSLEIENNLNITSINRVPFLDTLRKRLLTEGLDDQIITGVYYFGNLEIESMKTPSINQINIEDVVFDMDQQNISSRKHFWQKLDINGNIRVDFINGIDVEKTQEKSIMPGEGMNIDGSVTILRPSVVEGGIYTDYLNNYPVAKIKEILHRGTTRESEAKIHRMRGKIAGVVRKHLHYIQAMPTDYMYLEKSDAFQILVSDTVTAKAVTSKGYALLHVTAEEPGEKCGLPDSCRCPNQYSMEVSPEHSVAIFPNKGFHRTFSYDDGNMIVHFITNSISTDTVCRTSKLKVLNEVSMLSWNAIPTQNSSGASYQYDKYIQGYISGVEFFTLNGKSYAIIGRYYDSVVDTHDLDCIVIKFNEDKSKAQEIQRIPTTGAWSIYLFHTAQGVTLIIGSIKSRRGYIEEEQTLVYRFDEDVQEFKFLKDVPSYGCSVARGVVLGADSLIVLAHRSAPLRILKYNHHFDNYDFYQSFDLDAPVYGISVFYTGGFGISDAYLCIVTGNENYFIYSFQFIEGWKLESSGELEGLRNLIPLELNKQLYLFAPSTKRSSLLTVVKHGSV